MNWFYFQETGQDISAQIFNGCGKPQLNPVKQRKRRSISPKLIVADNTKRYFDDISKYDGLIDNLSSESAPTEEVESAPASVLEKSWSYETSNDVSAYTLNRKKRQTVPAQTERANNRDLVFEPLSFDGESEEEEINSSNRGRRKNKNNNRNNGNTSSKGRNDDDIEDNKEPPLDKLVKDIRTKVKDSKKFWSNLPYQICNNDDIAASPSNDLNCWNGKGIDR